MIGLVWQAFGLNEIKTRTEYTHDFEFMYYCNKALKVSINLSIYVRIGHHSTEYQPQQPD